MAKIAPGSLFFFAYSVHLVIERPEHDIVTTMMHDSSHHTQRVATLAHADLIWSAL